MIKGQWIRIMNKPMVSIIILCWNNLKYTKLCIESIIKYTKQPYQIIAIDQGSTDGTSDYLIKAIRECSCIVIKNEENKGFACGNNQALKLVEDGYVLMLNNDCEIMADDWLDLMINASKEAELIGAVCKQVAPDYITKSFKYIGDGKENGRWSYIEGWCLFANKDTWLSLNGFDERFNPAFSEDADLSFRAKELGMKIKAIELPIVHHGSKSIGQIPGSPEAMSAKNNRLLYEKWIGK